MIYTHMAAGIAGLAIGFAGAWNVQGWRYDSAELKRQEQVAADSRAQVRRIDKASEGFEADRSTARTEFIEITKEVERVVQKPVYRNVCFDDDGLRQLERAIGAPAGPGKPAGTMPRPEPAR